MKYLLIGALWGLSLFWFTEDAFEQGYLQGYEEGRDRALMSPQSLQTCTKWWFDGSESRARQAMNQYCERNKK